MTKRILICTDLDRTLLPNGKQARITRSSGGFHPTGFTPGGDFGLCQRPAPQPG